MRKKSASVRLTEDQLWGVIQMAEASVGNDSEMNRSERTGLEHLRRAHARLFKERRGR